MKKYFYILVLFLVILNIILCTQVWKLKRPQEKKEVSNESIFELEFILSSMIINSNLSINPYQTARIENDTSMIILKSQIDQPKFMFYYDEMSCSPCADKELQNLDSLAKIIGRENVFILTKFASAKTIYLLKRTNRINLRIIFIDDILNIPIFKYPTNFYFILDKDFDTKFFFVPSKTFNNLTKIYYSRIIKYLQTAA